MKTILKLASVLLAFFLLQNCNSTKVVSSYAAPNAASAVQNADKILVAAFLSGAATSRQAEAQLATLFPGKAILAHDVIANANINMTKEQLQQYITDNTVSVALVCRLVSTDKSLNYVPGNYDSFPPYYGGFYGYWDMAYADAYQPGYYTTDKSYKVETNLYDMKTAKLIYSALTDTYDPNSFQSGLSDIVATVQKNMASAGIVPAAK